MIGDSLQSDIQGVEKAGIKGMLVDRNNKREYSPKIESLEKTDTVLK